MIEIGHNAVPEAKPEARKMPETKGEPRNPPEGLPGRPGTSERPAAPAPGSDPREPQNPPKGLLGRLRIPDRPETPALGSEEKEPQNPPEGLLGRLRAPDRPESPALGSEEKEPQNPPQGAPGRLKVPNRPETPDPRPEEKELQNPPQGILERPGIPDRPETPGRLGAGSKTAHQEPPEPRVLLRERAESRGVSGAEAEQQEADLRKLRKNQGLMQLIRRAHGLVENADLEKHRQSQNHIGAILGNTRDISYRKIDIRGMYGEWVSVNRAHMKKYVILHCHGGGYSTGSSLYARTLTSKLAASTSMDVLCFDYRLAPENPYPAAVEDAMKVWDYLMLFGYGARDVILTGDSAGGNLALALVLKLKEQGRLLPRGMVLMSPWTDLTSSGESFENRAELDPVLNRPYIDRMVHAYAEGRDLKEPLISPLYGNFVGFPPTYIQVGENEILLSDSTRLHQAFVEANVSVKIDVYPGMWHVFQMSPVKAARDAMDKNAEFIYDICR